MCETHQQMPWLVPAVLEWEYSVYTHLVITRTFIRTVVL